MAALTPEQQYVEKQIIELNKLMPFYVQEYILSKKRAGFSPNTLLQYLYRYKHFFNWLLESTIVKAQNIASIHYEVLEKLEKISVELYLDHLKNENISSQKGMIEHRGEAVINLSINALKSLFNYLTKETEKADGECYFYRNVMSKIVIHTDKGTANHRARQISSVILNDDEITEFLHFIEHDYIHTLKSPQQIRSYERNALRDLAINSLMLGTGLRVGEVARIELNDVNLKKGMISVIRKGNKPDTILVLQSALKTLENYIQMRTIKYPRANQSPFLFVTNYGNGVTALSRRAIQNMVNKYTAAFSRSSKGISPHKLRHSFAVDFIRNGGDIILLRDQLGHNDIKTTSLYTNMANTDSQKVFSKMDETRKSRE
ncbi:tyrosine recombinase XerS [Butyricicoccus sp. 1XD8-22]|nr:tyrosine recombinase XerS [Butyricicoccus sp. 1XD8-22]